MVLEIIDIVAQVFAVVLGCWSMWLVNQKSKNNHNNKWACIIGLLSEPFWLYTLIFHGQWIAIIVKLFYTYSWGMGVINFWIKPYLKNKKNKL